MACWRRARSPAAASWKRPRWASARARKLVWLGAQGVGGERAECVGEFGAGVVEQAELVGAGIPLGGEEGVEFGRAGAQVGVFETQVVERRFEFGQAGGAGFGAGAGGGLGAQEFGVVGGKFGAQASGVEVAPLPQPQPAEEAQERERPRAQPEAEQKFRGRQVHRDGLR